MIQWFNVCHCQVAQKPTQVHFHRALARLHLFPTGLLVWFVFRASCHLIILISARLCIEVWCKSKLCGCMKLRKIISVPGNLMLLHHDAGHATIPELSFVPTSSASCICCTIPMWCLWGPTGANMLGHTTSPIRTSSSGKQRKLRFWSSTTCAEATQFNIFWFDDDDDPQCPIFSMAKLSHQSTRSTSPVVSLSLELVQLVELPRRLLAQQRQLDAGASGRVWRTRAPRRYRPFSRDGHWVWISGANFCMLGSRLVLSQICVHRTKTTLLIQHSKYEQIYDCAVAIRRPIQGMTHSVPTISGSTVFAREQATAAQVLTMGRRIGTRAWNQTMGPIAERKKWRQADAKL